MLLFFSKLALQAQILFIKFLDYYLLDNDEKIELFKDRAEVISSIISTFKEKHRSNNLTKIELYGFYDVFFNQYNKDIFLNKLKEEYAKQQEIIRQKKIIEETFKTPNETIKEILRAKYRAENINEDVIEEMLAQYTINIGKS